LSLSVRDSTGADLQKDRALSSLSLINIEKRSKRTITGARDISGNMNLATGWVAKTENVTPTACRSITVIGLPSDTTEADLQAIFKEWGKVEEVNNQAEGYGFAFIKYAEKGPRDTSGERCYAKALHACRKGIEVAGNICQVQDGKKMCGPVTRWKKDLVLKAQQASQVLMPQ